MSPRSTVNVRFRHYLGNTSWLLTERIYRVGLTLLVSVLLARYLGPDLFGQFSYAISLVALLTFLHELGLESVLVKELIERPDDRARIKGTAFVLKILGTLTMCLVLVPLCLLLNSEPYFNLYIAILAAGFFFQCLSVIDSEFQAIVASKYVAWSLAVQTTVGAVLKLACIWIQAPLLWIVVVQMIESVVLGIMLIYFNQARLGTMLKWTFDPELARRLIRIAWPLMLSGAAINIYMKIDQVMIKAMLTTADVGHYGVAVRISESIYFIPGIITASLFPAIVNATGTDAYQRRLQNLYDLVIWLAIIIAIPTALLSPLVISVLFGEAYHPASSVLALHIWAAVFVFFGLARGKWLVNEGLSQLVLLFTVAGAVANILMNYLLIPRLGIDGAAIATIISVAATTVLVPLLFTRTRPSVWMFVKSLHLTRAIRETLTYLR